MVARAASVLSDGIVLALTLVKTRAKSWNVGTLSEPVHSVRGTLLRDGSICFAFLCIINVIGIGTARQPETIEIIQTWTGILTSVLVSRLALDLQETAELENAHITEDDVALDTIIFIEKCSVEWRVTTRPDNTGGRIAPDEPLGLEC
ncbi:hypothetical protein DAEQUDRAFT_768983 [Daedalea quercina L-15889]|uniref:Uncharacterized protein n=1 Tax=Daedalea quercina L-15889 TaxID=1314783 RepID=A0A165M7P6_9APHY|nr:hypothetical protein DAEQUDRAFT_768983 [Daedalea quercina L-15889]